MAAIIDRLWRQIPKSCDQYRTANQATGFLPLGRSNVTVGGRPQIDQIHHTRSSLVIFRVVTKLIWPNRGFNSFYAPSINLGTNLFFPCWLMLEFVSIFRVGFFLFLTLFYLFIKSYKKTESSELVRV